MTTRTQKPRSEDPWKAIRPPTDIHVINARRIRNAGSHTWGLYWAVDSKRHCLLMLQHRSEHGSTHCLPRLRGLQVEAMPMEDGAGRRIVIRLTDAEQREIFQRFCADIVDATRASQSEREAIERFVVRTWRWHRLLKGGGDGRLSEEEQKGLMGEIWLLKRHLVTAVEAVDAVRAWKGPLGSAQDFELGGVSIEAKTIAPGNSTVRVSSAKQLDSDGRSRLFLYVVEATRASMERASAMTISVLAKETCRLLATMDMYARQVFEERLHAAGFDWNDDYSDSSWIMGKERIFEVGGEFPRITSGMVPSGVQRVKYVIALTDCERYCVTSRDLALAVCGGSNGDR